MHAARFGVPLLLLGAGVAQAVPLQLAHQGRLLDTEQSPLDGSHDLTFRVFDAPTDGVLLWEDTVTETFTGGYYATVLGADDANQLDDGIFATPPVYLELTVDNGEPLLPRQEINSVPFALRAGTAENLEGGYVDASEVAIDGEMVIDADGNWVGPSLTVAWEDVAGVPGGLDTLGGLSCSDGGVAKYDTDAGIWACGTDLVLSDTEVLNIVGGSSLDLGLGSSVDGGAIATLNDLDWSMLTGVPADLADDEDADTLADLGLVCAEGDRAAWDTTAGAWACASEVVGLDRIDTTGAVEGDVLTFDGSSLNWQDSGSLCPAGMVGVGDFCIEAVERSPSTYSEGLAVCGALEAHMCSFGEYHQACEAGVLTTVSGAHERTDTFYNVTGNVIAEAPPGCGPIVGSGVDSDWGYRCCTSK